MSLLAQHDHSGIIVAMPFDGGPVVTSDTVQCAHCDFNWEFRPGSGRRFGRCMRCGGLVCGRPWCNVLGCSHREQRLEEFGTPLRPLDWRPIIISTAGLELPRS